MRERGVARERDEAVLGESSLAAPIFDRSGPAVGAIGVVGETDRCCRGAAKGLRSAVIDAARGDIEGARRGPLARLRALPLLLPLFAPNRRALAR